jgi:hypothetical protein
MNGDPVGNSEESEPNIQKGPDTEAPIEETPTLYSFFEYEPNIIPGFAGNDPEVSKDEALPDGTPRKPNAWKESPVGLTKSEVFFVIFGLLLGLFLASLDQTITSTALPAIITDFKKMVRFLQLFCLIFRTYIHGPSPHIF